MQQRFFGVFLGEALVSAVLLPHVVRFWCLIRAFFLLSSRANIVGFLQGRRGAVLFFLCWHSGVKGGTAIKFTTAEYCHLHFGLSCLSGFSIISFSLHMLESF